MSKEKKHLCLDNYTYLFRQLFNFCYEILDDQWNQFENNLSLKILKKNKLNFIC